MSQIMQKFTLWISLILLLFVKLPLNGVEPSLEVQLEEYFKEHKISYYSQVRFYSYLYSAQYDAAEYSPAVLDAVTKGMVNHFFPDFCQCAGDPITERLAREILCPFFARLRLEDSSTRTLPSTCWFKPLPEVIAVVGKWMPWISCLPKPPPPLAAKNEKGWKEQFAELKEIRRTLTPQQREIATFWENRHKWLMIANQYMAERGIPLRMALQVSSLLMKGIYDGIIAELHAKYTFCVPRPDMMDPDFKSLIAKVETPSYPSGHSIQGAIFEVILSHFFPEDASYWRQLNEEVCDSRLWAGVHFPEDIVEGQILGKKIAAIELTENGRSLDVPPEQQLGSFQSQQKEISELSCR